MGLGLVVAGQLVEGSGQVVVGVGVVGVIGQGPLKGRHGQLALAHVGQQATQVVSGLHVVFIQLQRHVVPFPGAVRIALAIQQFGDLEADFGHRSGGGHGGPVGLHGRLQVALGVAGVGAALLGIDELRVQGQGLAEGGLGAVGKRDGQKTQSQFVPGVGFARVSGDVAAGRLQGLAGSVQVGQAVGLAQGAIDEVIKYARERIQFGRPIAGFQAIQFMIADMVAKTEAARLLTYQAARHLDKNERSRIPMFCSMAKFLASLKE